MLNNAAESQTEQMLCKYEANPQENHNAVVQSQQNLFASLLKSHPRTCSPRKIRSTFTELLRGTTSACQKKSKRLNL